MAPRIGPVGNSTRGEERTCAASLRVLCESALIPKDPLVWREDLPLSVRSRISGFLFAYGK